MNEARVVAFTSVGNGRHIRAVCLKHYGIEWESGYNLDGLFCVFEGNRTAEAEFEPEVKAFICRLDAAGIAVHDAAKTVTVRTQNIHAVTEGFADMQHHGIPELLCKVKLFRKPFLLILTGG